MGAGAKRKRGLGNARCNRVTVSLTNELYNQLKMLSVSLDWSISEVIEQLSTDAMQSTKYINALQDRYTKILAYRLDAISDYQTQRVTWRPKSS